MQWAPVQCVLTDNPAGSTCTVQQDGPAESKSVLTALDGQSASREARPLVGSCMQALGELHSNWQYDSDRPTRWPSQGMRLRRRR